jgi:hypothetical protein
VHANPALFRSHAASYHVIFRASSRHFLLLEAHNNRAMPQHRAPCARLGRSTRCGRDTDSPWRAWTAPSGVRSQPPPRWPARELKRWVPIQHVICLYVCCAVMRSSCSGPFSACVDIVPYGCTVLKEPNLFWLSLTLIRHC